MNAIQPADIDFVSDSTNAIARLRRLLSVVTRVRSTAKSTDGIPFRGSGDVAVRPLDADGLSIAESGEWASTGGTMMRFRNVYEWRFDYERQVVRLAHARFGPPVHLAELSCVGTDVWVSRAPHVCGSDSYRARLRITGTTAVLRWRVKGPRKCHVIRSVFSR